MSSTPSSEGRSRLAKIGRRILHAAQAAAVIALVTVPFGYATTAAPDRVALGAVSGLAVGLGLCLRLGERNGRLIGILVGALVGVAATLIAAGFSANPGPLVPPVLALAIGLMDGLGPSRIAGYREAARESLLVSGLLAVGLLLGPLGVLGAVAALVVVPTTTLYAGFLGPDASGRRFSRPPLLLLAAFAAMFVLVTLISTLEAQAPRSLAEAAFRAASTLVLVPLPVFLGARALAGFLRPRLRVYLDLAEYLRVMWIPIGGFAIGYLAIIVVFAGFAGMLERFYPGSFSGASGAGVAQWILFSFYAAIAEPYSSITPASGAARLLTGAQLVLSVGWALVVFAAVMSAIQPQLDRIARRRATDRDPDSP